MCKVERSTCNNQIFNKFYYFFNLIFLLFIFIFIISCIYKKNPRLTSYDTIQKTSLEIGDELQSISYIGSDEIHHYFVEAHFLYAFYYKILKYDPLNIQRVPFNRNPTTWIKINKRWFYCGSDEKFDYYSDTQQGEYDFFKILRLESLITKERKISFKIKERGPKLEYPERVTIK